MEAMFRDSTRTTRRSSPPPNDDERPIVWERLMFDATGRTVVHLIEPQHLFVPALIDVFTEAGLFVDFVSAQIDPRKLLDDQPHLVFLDTDFIDEPLENIRLAHILAPGAQIYVYSSDTNDAISRAFMAAGADIVLKKSAERRHIVQSLHEVERRRRQRHLHDR
jgi:DNA-binding NarL/FixJ family response regulator